MAPTSLYPPGFPPTWQIPQALLKRQRPIPVAFPRSYTFDPVTGDFAVDANGRVLVCGPQAAAAQRAAKAASTQQGAYTAVYSRAFGVDLESAVRRARPRPQTEATLADGIRRAIRRRDARARDAEAFSFEWADVNRLTATWTLVLADGTRVRGQQVELP